MRAQQGGQVSRKRMIDQNNGRHLDIQAEAVGTSRASVSYVSRRISEAELEQAFAKFGVRKIVNTDQGSQLTAEVLTGGEFGRGAKLSRDGRGAWRNNELKDRLCRNMKYRLARIRA